MFYPETLEKRLDNTLSTIHSVATKAGRNPKNINIVAVTKNLQPEIWKKALNVGLHIIGENRVQEAHLKVKQFSATSNIELHFIGHLQSNKVNKAVELFDVIETVDSIKLANKINMVASKKQKKQKIFLQINTSEDPKKYGLTIENTPIVAKAVSTMEHINLLGIMMIPMQNISLIELTKIYRKTRKLRDIIQKDINTNCNNLSMGMSNDYTVAIKEGATHIRLGTALFGLRDK